MKLSISNIAWDQNKDREMYKYISESDFCGIEIAPTRIIQVNPYDQLDKARDFQQYIKTIYNLEISSMQSIWFGRSEKLFGLSSEKEFLLGYTKKAIDFAYEIGCRNLVFGSPRNRRIKSPQQLKEAIHFFRELGDYAHLKKTTFSIEANPPIYGSNFITNSEEAFGLVERVNSNGFRVNLDLGTILINNEDIQKSMEYIDKINHIHISEPNLKPIQHRSIHNDLAKLLKEANYDKYISIEMVKPTNTKIVKDSITYIKEVFIDN